MQAEGTYADAYFDKLELQLQGPRVALRANRSGNVTSPSTLRMPRPSPSERLPKKNANAPPSTSAGSEYSRYAGLSTAAVYED